jgi:hypothetical protein
MMLRFNASLGLPEPSPAAMKKRELSILIISSGGGPPRNDKILAPEAVIVRL